MAPWLQAIQESANKHGLTHSHVVTATLHLGSFVGGQSRATESGSPGALWGSNNHGQGPPDDWS